MPRRAPFAATMAGPLDEFEVPPDLAARLKAACRGRLTIDPELLERIAAELEFIAKTEAHERRAQATTEVTAQISNLCIALWCLENAICATRDALHGLGQDALPAVEHALNRLGLRRDADDPTYDVSLELEQLKRAVEDTLKELSGYPGTKGPTILRRLTFTLRPLYERAAGKPAGTRADGPFVRFVLAAHDVLPLRLQAQNPDGTPEGRLRSRPRDFGHHAVLEALLEEKAERE